MFLIQVKRKKNAVFFGYSAFALRSRRWGLSKFLRQKFVIIKYCSYLCTKL